MFIIFFSLTCKAIHQTLMPDPYPKAYLYKRVVRAKLFIDAHYAGNIDLDHISGEVNFSKFHFIRLFRKAYGKTPYQYLTTVRIYQAKLLLQEGQSVSFTCSALGFESPGSFSRLFKQIIGMSPSEYSEQQAGLKQQASAQPLAFIPGCFAQSYGWTKKAILDK
jgi:AraC-like DNA-binding protein